ncbi:MULTISPECIES: FxSxx-COOH cyclophane-containing RiPP peptide [unclassified Streptomyces]|uniref:FxSxx-COOH cyclophane-containing RiPP peptide n=1 Tax=unclassified Streptomyces TaxID=2593676 RepID=UPI000DD838E1|nr:MULTISPECIES: FxSxx-COOH cyclophane-containing RiPP peptide [unclassified Streptomyces]QZZ30152.1 FXSXX-COOH protein [Streptomyces sp. ST1015]
MDHEDLPDLLTLDLEELRNTDHPVLRELLADLTDRAAGPAEMFWGHGSAL